MLAPRRNRANRKQKVESASVPAPIGGINARDSLAAMPETDAVYLDNWFCETGDVSVRNGQIQTSAYDGAESLMAYNGLTDNILLAAGGANIFTGTATNGLPVYYSSLINARLQHINFATSGGKFMYMVNGENNALLFDGATVTPITGVSSPISITGVDTAKFIHVNSYKRRLWFTEKISTKAWYLPVDSVGGAAVSFDFGPLFRLGGYLMGTLTWTINDSGGTNEYFVAVSSEGECLVYQGLDPSSAGTWWLAGRFVMGRPVGRRFYENIGSDVVLITSDGVVPLSQSLLSNARQLNTAISDKIRDLINLDIRSYAGAFGWQVCYYPLGQKVIVNVPQTENARQYQYVMNASTGSWSTFGYYASPWNADCFAVMDDKLYYGSVAENGVWQCDTGSFDDDTTGTISSRAKQAFNYFGSRGQQKYFTMSRPILQFDGEIQLSLGFNTDFRETEITSITTINAGTGGTLWDVSDWDTPDWALPDGVAAQWKTTAALGYCAAFKMALSTNNPLSWVGTDIVYQKGGIL